MKKVVIPRKGKPGAARRQVQARRSLRKLVKWRTGSEARISSLKRDHGWRRTLVDGIDGAETWCGWGVLANNATKVSALLEAKAAPAAPARAPRPAASPATGTPGRRRSVSAA